MSIEGRVRESLRRELHASRPLVIDGDHDLDACWALDRAYVDGDVATPVQQVLDEVRLRPAQRATVAVAARMAEHLQRYRWPADLVVVPVPSSDPVVELLARAVAWHLEVPCRSLLKLRAGMAGWPIERRISARARTVPAHVLLIDDRLSSGRTLRTCAWALRDRGAQAVWAMVAAADVRTEAPAGPGATDAPRMHERGDLVDVWRELVGEELELPVLDAPPAGADDTSDHELHADEGVADDATEVAEEVEGVEEVDAGSTSTDRIAADDLSLHGTDHSSAHAPRRPPKRRNRRTHRR